MTQYVRNNEFFLVYSFYYFCVGGQPPAKGNMNEYELDTVKKGSQLFTKNTAFSKLDRGSIRSESCPMRQSEILWLTLWVQRLLNGRSNSDCDNVAQSIVY